LESQLAEKDKEAVEAASQEKPPAGDETESTSITEDDSMIAPEDEDETKEITNIESVEKTVEVDKISSQEPVEKTVEEDEVSNPEPVEKTVETDKISNLEPVKEDVETEKISAPEPAEELSIELGNGVKVDFVLILPGEFDMGSSSYEKDRDPDEGPVHKVRISRPFYIARSEVTREQFSAFVNATGYVTDAEKKGWAYGRDGKQREKDKGLSWRNAGFPQQDNHPVVCVSWNDAKAFCDGLSQGLKEGTRFRLPTEAEWEYACRANSSKPFSVGTNDETLHTCGNYADSSAKLPSADKAHDDNFRFTAPVRSLKPNMFGLYDMHGNVWEWCSDWYSDDYYSKSPPVDPIGPARGKHRVLRGGCWFSDPKYCRSANRSYSGTNDASATGGFRIVFEF
jgi:formylglycine-generating enzyme required for sulfatase activity